MLKNNLFYFVLNRILVDANAWSGIHVKMSMGEHVQTYISSCPQFHSSNSFSPFLGSLKVTISDIAEENPDGNKTIPNLGAASKRVSPLENWVLQKEFKRLYVTSKSDNH